jgi:hypothetical protein
MSSRARWLWRHVCPVPLEKSRSARRTGGYQGKPGSHAARGLIPSSRSTFWFLTPEQTEELDTYQAHKARQDHTPDGSCADAPLKEKNQGDGCANYLSLAESEAKNGTPSRLNRCAFRVGMHCPKNLSRSRKATQRRPGYKLVTSGRRSRNGANAYAVSRA